MLEITRYQEVLHAVASGHGAASAIPTATGLPEPCLRYSLQHFTGLGYLWPPYPLEGQRPNPCHIRFGIDDPSLRFWFRFVFPNVSVIRASGATRALADRISPSLDTWFGGCFERLSREALPLIYGQEAVAVDGRLHCHPPAKAWRSITCASYDNLLEREFPRSPVFSILSAASVDCRNRHTLAHSPAGVDQHQPVRTFKDSTMTPNARFTEFIADINPSPTTTARSSAAHDSVRSALWADRKYSDDLIRDFLGGSYRRQTAIRPMTKDGDTERPDVDIYVVVRGEPWTTTPVTLIDDLYAALDRNRSALHIVRLAQNRCSVSIATNSADMDVSPLLERQPDGYYRIGNRHKNEWYATDPEAHINWSSEVNSTYAGRLKPTVKMIKWARRENPTQNKHPKSFPLEVIVADHMCAAEDHYGKIVHGMFDSFANAYSLYRTQGTCPRIDDPAIPNGDLLAGVSGDAFCSYFDEIAKHRDDASKALLADDQDEATMYWRRIFGKRFPGPKSSSSAHAAEDAISMSPLMFPSSQAQPPNRPAKFA